MKYSLLLLLLQGCTSIDISMYTGVDYHVPDELVGVVEIEARYNEQCSCKYLHRSEITRGFPFNHLDEIGLADMVLCGYTYNLWKEDK